ncbi:MAG: CpXC domain-containing protein [Spirochaetales bacterium]|uniref:CpXC domain-containing protein n=1 Tax=Candidatus Thalassospirochaeta sargassi TaxID=3119039 RepID=A0AAJ1MHU9_9SPIO|nr:CpXC domain-containing protein [Spirochaetales bacterium]
MIKIPCHCGNIIESDMNTEIDLASTPEIYARIIDGTFMTFSCPQCGNELKTEVELHLFDKGEDFDIQFLPELERANFLSGGITATSKRIAIGYNELVEKTIIAGTKLDDRIIEIIKFRMLEKADKDNLSITFNSVEGSDLVFHIAGLKPDQIGISHIPMSVYQNLENKIDELLVDDDIKLFTDGPYVSVSRVYLED